MSRQAGTWRIIVNILLFSNISSDDIFKFVAVQYFYTVIVNALEYLINFQDQPTCPIDLLLTIMNNINALQQCVYYCLSLHYLPSPTADQTAHKHMASLPKAPCQSLRQEL